MPGHLGYDRDPKARDQRDQWHRCLGSCPKPWMSYGHGTTPATKVKYITYMIWIKCSYNWLKVGTPWNVLLVGRGRKENDAWNIKRYETQHSYLSTWSGFWCNLRTCKNHKNPLRWSVTKRELFLEIFGGWYLPNVYNVGICWLAGLDPILSPGTGSCSVRYQDGTFSQWPKAIDLNDLPTSS